MFPDIVKYTAIVLFVAIALAALFMVAMRPGF